MRGSHELEGAGHLDLVVTEAVAGFAGEDAGVQAVDQRIKLPVLREEQPFGGANLFLMLKDLIGRQIKCVGKT
ncbi:hypothetical protein [Rubritalea halochordaticola]|uniref:hypothetical protein n=1 Tax=Rubritalea halochordaticola TaxID=714537 RepID=UPI0031FBAC5E